MKENLKLIRQSISEGVEQAQVLPGQVAARYATLNQKVKTLHVALLAIAGVLLWNGVAYAANCGGGNAAETITDFIGVAATFVIAVAGAAALLMFAIGGFMIILGEAAPQKYKGMQMIKNAVIGLVILGVGVFVKFIVLELVEGATGSKNNDRVAECVGVGDAAQGG